MLISATDRPNPQPLPSNVPNVVEDLLVKLDKPTLAEDQNEALQKFRRAANYIAAAMIFLSDNVYIQRDLTFDDIKPRLLGHWGTCPGLTLVYSHLNVLIEKHDLDVLYVVGPGHGAPSILANLWIEGSLEKFYPECSRDARGLHNLITGFSTTGGFPSHINSGTPGAIHEGKQSSLVTIISYADSHFRWRARLRIVRLIWRRHGQSRFGRRMYRRRRRIRDRPDRHCVACLQISRSYVSILSQRTF